MTRITNIQQYDKANNVSEVNKEYIEAFEEASIGAYIGACKNNVIRIDGDIDVLVLIEELNKIKERV